MATNTFVKLAARAGAAVETVRGLASKPSVRRWLLGVAALAFLVMAYVSFQQLDDVGRSAQPLYIVPLVVLAVPGTLLLNALEYRAMASSLGHDIGVRSAARVSLAATLANYLPAPGGIAVRTAALKGRGSSVGSALSINAIAGVLWLGVAGVATGIALVVTTSLIGRGVAAALGGAVGVVVAALWARRRRPEDWWPTFRQLFYTEVGVVAVAGLRVWLALYAIGQAAPVGAAVAISSSTVIAAAVGVFPAGLGLREFIGGGLAVAVDVPLAAAIAALAVDRVASPIGTVLCVPFVGFSRGKKGQQQPEDGGDGDVEQVEDVADTIDAAAEVEVELHEVVDDVVEGREVEGLEERNGQDNGASSVDGLGASKPWH